MYLKDILSNWKLRAMSYKGKYHAFWKITFLQHNKNKVFE